MVLSKGKEFSILVKINRNFLNVETNVNVIAIEIHEVQKIIVADQTKVEIPIKKQRSKKTKKLSDNEKNQRYRANIPHVILDIVAVETDIEIPQKKTNRFKRTKKIDEVTAEENSKKVRIHMVEKQNVPDESEDEI